MPQIKSVMKNTDKQKSGEHTDPTYKNSDTGKSSEMKLGCSIK